MEDYLKEYRAKSGELLELAKHLMRLIDPAAKERWDGAATEKNAAAKPAAAPVDVVTEIQRYKGLLDAGIITEEAGTNSHSAIVGLTLDKAVIVGATNATRTLKDGMTISMDCARGVVQAMAK